MSKKNFAVAWLGSFPIYWNCWTRLSFSSVPIQLNIVSNSMSSFCCVAAGESSTSIFWALLLSFSLEIGNSSMHNSRIPSVHFPHCQLFQQILERILINVDNLRRKTKLRAKFLWRTFYMDLTFVWRPNFFLFCFEIHFWTLVFIVWSPYFDQNATLCHRISMSKRKNKHSSKS